LQGGLQCAQFTAYRRGPERAKEQTLNEENRHSKGAAKIPQKRNQNQKSKSALLKTYVTKFSERKGPRESRRRRQNDEEKTFRRQSEKRIITKSTE
jgi:hypothetical protein